MIKVLKFCAVFVCKFRTTKSTICLLKKGLAKESVETNNTNTNDSMYQGLNWEVYFSILNI